MTKITALSKTILFLTGAFIGNNCWNEWKKYFESKGYHTLAPPWPYKDLPPEELRNRRFESAIASIRLMQVVDHFELFIKQLPEKPILIGHSLAGLIVQVLLQHDLGSAGVAIHAFPSSGAGRLNFSFIIKWRTALPFSSTAGTPYLIPFRKWKRDLANARGCEDQRQSYYKYAIPESRLLIKDLLTKKLTIDPGSPHAPLLFTSGSRDRLSPPSTVYRSYRKMASDHSITDYKEFQGLDHLLFDHPGWKNHADFILSWLQNLS